MAAGKWAQGQLIALVARGGSWRISGHEMVTYRTTSRLSREEYGTSDMEVEAPYG
jgi:hypothetical protein